MKLTLEISGHYSDGRQFNRQAQEIPKHEEREPAEFLVFGGNRGCGSGIRGAVAEAQQAAPQTAPSTARVESDIVFGKGGDMDIRLDIYHP